MNRREKINEMKQKILDFLDEYYIGVIYFIAIFIIVIIIFFAGKTEKGSKQSICYCPCECNETNNQIIHDQFIHNLFFRKKLLKF
jgi:hypothetical protein